ncbi:MAG: phosphatase PAP2 family protein [Candidatus Paceibacterota bacterium]|jgi:undecaprenyl-diphosphatase
MNEYIFQLINGLAGRYPVLDALGVFFAEYFGYLLALLTVIILWKSKGLIVRAFLAGIVARFGFAEVIRLLWPHSRPFIDNDVNLLLTHEATSSFPSGHTSFFFALAAVIYAYNKKAGVLFMAGSFLVSISRVFGGVHWPADILGGILVGLLSGWLVIKVFKKS